MAWFQTLMAAGSGGGNSNFLSGLVAYWDFSESAAPFISKMGTAGPVALNNGAGSSVTKVSDGPTGHALQFNGTSDYLICPASENGLLNIGKNGGNSVSVLAFFKVGVAGGTNDFIAGIWQEDDNNPRRQYGAFYSLPMYGGGYKSCLHVSKNGGPTPGYEFSIDYSANGYTEGGDLRWMCLAGTYDGSEARSYIESRFEPYPDFAGRSKNPYSFPDGLNSADGDFTVGAVKLTTGMGNFVNGRLAGIMVFNRKLSAIEIAKCQRWIDTANNYGFRCSYYRSDTTNQKPVSFFGCQAYISPTCVDRSNDTASGAWKSIYSSNVSSISSGPTSPSGIRAFVDPVIPSGITTENLQAVTAELANTSLTPKWRILLKIDNTYYASEADYGVDAIASNTFDWSNQKTVNHVFSKAAAGWRDVVINPGVELTLASTARTVDLPSGAITAFGLIKDGSSPGDMQFRNLTLKVKPDFIS